MCDADLCDSMLGKSITIRGVIHICLAQNADTLVFLQLDEDYEPCQYVGAHEPYNHEGELCWLNGDYYPLWNHPDSLAVLKKVIKEMRK